MGKKKCIIESSNEQKETTMYLVIDDESGEIDVFKTLKAAIKFSKQLSRNNVSNTVEIII